MVMAFAAKDDEESEEEKSDVLADLGTTDDDDVSDGATNAWDVLSAMDAARRMVLAAENSFMVGRIVMIYYSCGDDIMVKRYLDVMILSANGWIGSVMIMQWSQRSQICCAFARSAHLKMGLLAPLATTN